MAKKDMMIDYSDLSDEDYEKILEPFEEETKKYLEKIAYDYVTYYLAMAFKYKALENDCDILPHINAALDDIGYINEKINLKVSTIKKMLKQKYGLTIKNESPLEIVDTKKEDQR